MEYSPDLPANIRGIYWSHQLSYPIVQFSLRIGSDDIDKGLFLGIPIAVALAFGITILILKSG